MSSAMCWNRVQHRHSEDSMDYKELDSFYMCNKGRGVRLPVYQEAVERTKHKCDISGHKASTFCTLHSHAHMVCVTQSRFMF